MTEPNELAVPEGRYEGMRLRVPCGRLAPLVVNGTGGFVVTCQRDEGHAGNCLLVVEWSDNQLIIRDEVSGR